MLIDTGQVGEEHSFTYEDYIVCAQVTTIFHIVAGQVSPWPWGVASAIWLKAEELIEDPVQNSLVTDIKHREVRPICL